MDWTSTLTTAQAVREILLSIALLAGGIWALYRYWYLERPDAQLDFKSQESQIGLTSYLNIDIRHTLHRDQGAFHLIGDVHIENPGTKGLSLDLTQLPPIRISRLHCTEGGQYAAAPDPLTLAFTASEPIPGVYLEGEGKGSLKFVARLAGPELYAVEFWCKSPQTEGFWMSYIIVDVSEASLAAQTKEIKAGK